MHAVPTASTIFTLTYLPERCSCLLPHSPNLHRGPGLHPAGAGGSDSTGCCSGAARMKRLALGPESGTRAGQRGGHTGPGDLQSLNCQARHGSEATPPWFAQTDPVPGSGPWPGSPASQRRDHGWRSLSLHALWFVHGDRHSRRCSLGIRAAGSRCRSHTQARGPFWGRPVRHQEPRGRDCPSRLCCSRCSSWPCALAGSPVTCVLGQSACPCPSCPTSPTVQPQEVTHLQPRTHGASERPPGPLPRLSFQRLLGLPSAWPQGHGPGSGRWAGRPICK